MKIPALIACLGLALLICPSQAEAQDQPPVQEPPEPEIKLELEEPEDGWLSRGRYIGGGVTGTIFGFGIGHIIVDEWTNFGWVFTTSQVVGATIAFLALPELFEGDSVFGDAALAMFITGEVIVGASLIWEKIDLWRRPTKRLERTPSEHPEQPDEPEISEEDRRKAEAQLAEVEQATGRDMDDDFEDYLESDDFSNQTFAAHVYRRYKRKRAGGIVLATVTPPILLAASGGFAVLGVMASDGLFTAFSVGTGVLGVVSLVAGIRIAKRARKVRDAVEPLLDRSTEQASFHLRLTVMADSRGIPSGGGLKLTF